jgi:glycine dehydrogenase subunit 2
MLTNPNTLGIFNSTIKEVADIVHSVDAQLYYDGANLNAVLGKFRPGDANFDAVHVNLHKTFATPHGGGGPGSGPVGVCETLVPYLPISRVVKRDDGTFTLDYKQEKSIGYVAPFYGNFGVILKAYAYMLTLGRKGVLRVSENAVLNANYIRCKLAPYFEQKYDRVCMHECVFSPMKQAAKGVHTLDIAKALIDKGIHPPTIYFPLIVPEALMIEPTETESKEEIDTFIAAMIEIAERIDTDPESVTECPLTTPVKRLDETTAARKPNVADV